MHGSLQLRLSLCKTTNRWTPASAPVPAMTSAVAADRIKADPLRMLGGERKEVVSLEEGEDELEEPGVGRLSVDGEVASACAVARSGRARSPTCPSRGYAIGNDVTPDGADMCSPWSGSPHIHILWRSRWEDPLENSRQPH